MIYDHHNDGYAKEYEVATHNIFDDGHAKQIAPIDSQMCACGHFKHKNNCRVTMRVGKRCGCTLKRKRTI